MRTISDLALSTLAGSQSGVTVVADVWRGGVLLTTSGPLPCASWTVNWDTTRQIQGQANLVVTDAEGLLAPWGFGDTLAVGGSRVHLRYLMPDAGDEVSLGWFRVVKADVVESWRFHPTGSKWLSTGATIRLACDELTWQVVQERFLAPESPQTLTSVLGEMKRLLDGIVPLGSTAGITDKAVPSTIAYTKERMNAVEDLATSVGAVHRMSDAGLLDLLPVAPGASVWTIAAADNENGVLIDLGRAQDASTLPNAAIVEGTATDGSQLIGLAVVPSGPLAFGGPHGRIPTFMASPLMTTQAMCDAAAATFLTSTLAQRKTILPVTCLPNPALQGWDTVAIVSTIGTMTGQVQTMGLSGNTAGVQPMTLGVSVGADQLAIIAGAARARG